MIGRVAAHVADSHRKTLSHANDAELGYGILFEILVDEVLAISVGEQVAARPKILFQHRGG